MRWRLVMVAAAGFALSAPMPRQDAKPDPIQKALDELAGTWDVTAAEFAGKKEDPGHTQFIFKGRELTVVEDGKTTAVGRFLLDPTTRPKRIALPRSGYAYVPGIYAVEGDTLKLCLGGAGQGQPTEFTTDPKSHRRLLVLKRKRPDAQ